MCERESEAVLSWGVRDVHDPGLSVSMRCVHDRLVIEIRAPMSLLNLGRFAENAEDAHGADLREFGWSGRRESNPHDQLGRLGLCH